MGIAGYFTLVVIVGMIITLITETAGADFVLFAVLALFTITGSISPKEALAGFSNKGMITVGALFIVSQGIMNTGALRNVARYFLSEKKDQGIARLMLKIMLPVACMSAFLNNTPIVVIFTPIIKKWAENLDLSASKFLIPLSYAAIFGGVCTLIGTSTNLVVHGLMLENNLPGFSMFELGQVGVPAAILGFGYLALFGKKRLPDRKDIIEIVGEKRREYLIEMLVTKTCPLIGKTIRKGGLRNLKGLYLMEIERNGKTIRAVSGDEVIQENDRLMFTGITSAVVELQNIPGFVPVTQETFDHDFLLLRNQLVEAVVSPKFPALGKTVKAYHFRAIYDAAVIAVHRNGERINSKIGSIELKTGDTLLLLAKEDFLARWEHSEDFYLISHIQSVTPKAKSKARIALGILLAMIIGATIGKQLPPIGGYHPDMFYFAFAAAVLMVVSGCLSENEARHAISWNILITIACAFGISKALQNSGAASAIAGFIIDSMQVFGPVGVLAGIYIMTTVFTELITNNAAAALIFPIALAAAQQMGVDPKPFFVAITIGASASFSTPIGYQTNLIVQGAGGYKFVDYLKIGIPLNILFWIISVILIPFFWKF